MHAPYIFEAPDLRASSMDPITAITTAIIAGAAAGLGDTATAAVRDGYAALKSLLARKFGAVDLDAVEKKPNSEARQAVLGEGLNDAGAAADPEVLAAAQALLKLIEEHASGAAAAVGVDIEKIRAANVTIENVRATGAGVKARDVDAAGDFSIRDVTAGGDPPEKKA